MGSRPDRVKTMRRVALFGLIVALAVAGLPLLIGLATLGKDESWGLNFRSTVPIDALNGLPSLVLLIIVSIIGRHAPSARPPSFVSRRSLPYAASDSMSTVH
ncbi:MAG: hypothetical protein WCL31_06990 [Actinomycetes bacterium]